VLRAVADQQIVETEGGETLRAPHVVIATDPTAAARLVDGLATGAMRGSTTVYFTDPSRR
jgi:hypothetical protein